MGNKGVFSYLQRFDQLIITFRRVDLIKLLILNIVKLHYSLFFREKNDYFFCPLTS